MNNNATNQSYNSNNHSRSQFNYTKWGFVLAIVGTFIGFLSIPSEVKCTFWKTDACKVSKTNNEVQKRDFNLIVKNSSGEGLGGVTIQVIGSGIPESVITDNAGFAQVTIPSKGDVRVFMSKENYKTNDLFINLENEPSTTRIVQLLTKQERPGKG
jgi:hypothetical protein